MAEDDSSSDIRGSECIRSTGLRRAVVARDENGEDRSDLVDVVERALGHCDDEVVCGVVLRVEFDFVLRAEDESPGHPVEQAPQSAGLRRLPGQPFVLGRQPAGLARGQRALGVGVAPAARVALGHDQDVLAQRGQVFVAERAAVGRRLEVLRAPDRPPLWGRQAGV
jgi:hypothetical protein